MQANPSHTSENLKLEPINNDCFIQIEVDSKGGQLRQLIERENLTFKPGCAFFEFMNKKEDIDEKKAVILMEKVFQCCIIMTDIISAIQNYRKQGKCLQVLQLISQLELRLEILINQICRIKEYLYRVYTKEKDSSMEIPFCSIKYSGQFLGYVVCILYYGFILLSLSYLIILYRILVLMLTLNLNLKP